MSVLEGEWTRKLLKRLRGRLPDAFVRKLSDQYTGGLPDFVVSMGGRTTWWEVKVLPNRPSPLQKDALRRIGPAGALIEVDKEGAHIWVQEAGLLLNLTYDGLVEYIIKKTKGEPWTG